MTRLAVIATLVCAVWSGIARAAPPALTMIDIPAGSFAMGSPSGDPDEVPVRTVNVKAFKLAKLEVTVGEFRRFVAQSGYAPARGCNRYVEGKLTFDPALAWDAPAFPQTDNHPVVCVGWIDAMAYIAWYNAETGARYRLPSEAEFEYAATTGGQPTGSDPNVCSTANIMDATALTASAGRFVLGDPNQYKSGELPAIACRDGHPFTAPAGSYTANRYGLHDLLGNAWEYVADCIGPNYEGTPTDGSAVDAPGCTKRGIRGGSWNIGPKFARFQNRSSVSPETR
ncbi:MAG: SUMF1/EgtB/PvdO family nonheme iron enzyme, partial [Rhodospirillaceae bacterium]|nr:SUMF1/EgtB/PvdO family nonheme iron enzyme [Rhodospirillaceae bacterium]